MNIRDYIKHKENKAVKIKKDGDGYVAEITTYNIYTGKKEINEEKIDVERYTMEKEMFENEMNRAKEQLEKINLLLDDLNK